MIRASYPVQRSSRPLTERQRAILAHITAFTAEHSYAPTMRELGDLLGIASSHGVLDHLWALRRKGYVEWVDGKARTLRVVKEGDRA
jgi:repressor LexA